MVQWRSGSGRASKTDRDLVVRLNFQLHSASPKSTSLNQNAWLPIEWIAWGMASNGCYASICRWVKIPECINSGVQPSRESEQLAETLRFRQVQIHGCALRGIKIYCASTRKSCISSFLRFLKTFWYILQIFHCTFQASCESSWLSHCYVAFSEGRRLNFSKALRKKSSRTPPPLSRRYGLRILAFFPRECRFWRQKSNSTDRTQWS